MKLTFKNNDVELRTPEEVQKITELLNSRGARCYIIGGFTRDVLLGKNPKNSHSVTSIENTFSSQEGILTDSIS